MAPTSSRPTTQVVPSIGEIAYDSARASTSGASLTAAGTVAPSAMVAMPIARAVPASARA